MPNGEDNPAHHDPGPANVLAGATGGADVSHSLGGGLSGNVADVIGQLGEHGKNGIIVNAILIWIDVQMRGTPDNCWSVGSLKRR